jgi:hypothetical protein
MDTKQAPILTEPFTHEQVDQYYADMYRWVMVQPGNPLDMQTLIAVHNFFEFEANSGMMLDAWLHAEMQKLAGKSYLPVDEPKEKNYSW